MSVTTYSEYWQARSAELGTSAAGRNIAYEAVTRHVREGRGERVALRFVSSGVSMTYADLDEASDRFANALGDLGIGSGERVFTVLGRREELYVTVLGALKAKCVVSPLFAAFGPAPIRERMAIGEGAAVVTTGQMLDRKIASIRDDLPALRHVIVVDRETRADASHFRDLVDAASPDHEIPATAPDDPALLHFTSGTTGTPKGAMHVHDAVVAHRATAQIALGLRPDDVYWCTADPGWVTGTSYGIVAPLVLGAEMVVDEAEFEAERWYRTLQDHRVNVWYTAPTAIRMLMRAGDELARGFDLSALRTVASVGEPLHAEAVAWAETVLGLPIHDTWWQTETGAIMIANPAGEAPSPGSMGVALPGTTAVVIERTDKGDLRRDETGALVMAAEGASGELALRTPWPSMFRAYINEPERYDRCFVDGWYLTGDLVRRNGDGRFWFVGRGDDVIKSSGHLIGPFEVERVLMRHPAVVEAGVIGRPDPVAGEVVKAFVSLRAGFDPSDDLRAEILGFARKALGPAVAPRDIEFDNALPKTKSGKILRRLLRARELGEAVGDVSTLEVQR